MTNFHIVFTATLYFSISILFASCSYHFSPKKRSNPSSPVKSPVCRSPLPDWFENGSEEGGLGSWNIFGQWFDQRTSLPLGALYDLKPVNSIEDFWSFVSPSQLDSNRRIDICLFRPGFSPEFSSSIASKSQYLLSYKITPFLIKIAAINSSTNPAQKVPDHFMHIFDPVISAVMNPVEAVEASSKFLSDVVGFRIKRQYEHTFFQIFVTCENIKIYDAKVEIFKLVTKAFPTVYIERPKVSIVPLRFTKTKSSLSTISDVIPAEPVESPELVETKSDAQSEDANSDPTAANSADEPSNSKEDCCCVPLEPFQVDSLDNIITNSGSDLEDLKDCLSEENGIESFEGEFESMNELDTIEKDDVTFQSNLPFGAPKESDPVIELLCPLSLEPLTYDSNEYTDLFKLKELDIIRLILEEESVTFSKNYRRLVVYFESKLKAMNHITDNDN